MHHSRLACVVIDSRTDDLDGEAEFWSAVLGWPASTPGGSDRYRDIDGPDDQPKVLVQKVEHESRVHLDIETDDIEAEVKRLEALGAKRIGLVKSWCVMEAPSGQRFCVVKPQRKDFPAGANQWP
ncbi:MAG: VOC family protein [Kiloniellaceae bacterium]